MTKSPAKTALGEMLAMARKQKGMAQGEVAEALGCNTNEISLYERGSRMPSVPRLCALLELYNVQPGPYLMAVGQRTNQIKRAR